jgi:hypothetical protein
MARLTLDKKLESKLPNGIVTFQYRKKDGTIRYAVGTQDLGMIPSANHPKNGASIKNTVNSISYYDFAKQGLRSLSRANVMRIAATVTK